MALTMSGEERDPKSRYQNPRYSGKKPLATYGSGNKMIAACGHEDSLGHLTGTVCGSCARKGHKKAMGR
jgi:hypothetical protein